jgi:hypothetical protein
MATELKEWMREAAQHIQKDYDPKRRSEMLNWEVRIAHIIASYAAPMDRSDLCHCFALTIRKNNFCPHCGGRIPKP